MWLILQAIHYVKHTNVFKNNPAQIASLESTD
jgi:hypothetical protein